MRIFAAGRFREVHAGDVDLADEKYRISRIHPDDRLARSIEMFGLLESPVLLNGPEKYTIVFGHNRIKALLGSGKDRFTAVIVDSIGRESYIEYAVLKSFRNELGPAGKLRLIDIALNVLGIDAGRAEELARTALGVGHEFVRRPGLRESVLRLPPALVAYLDSRDIGYKVIRNLLRLPEDGVKLLTHWLEQFPVRVNIFREIVDMMIDIRKRDGSLERLGAIDMLSGEDRKLREDHIFREISRIRYPEYNRIKEEADAIIRKLREERIDAALPPYFDGDSISLSVNFNKREDPASVIERLSRIDAELVKKLLGLL